MAIAHICLQCGFDLARVRPVREPHYRLPIVTCPGCAAVVVRRVHPMSRGWKTFLRLDAVLRVLCVQLLFLISLSTLTTVASILIVHEQGLPARSAHAEELAWLYVLTFGVLAPITGAWLTAGFSHVRQHFAVVWLAWLGVLFAEVFLFIVFCVAINETPFDYIPRNATTLWSDCIRLILLPAMMIEFLFLCAAMAGVPVGRLALRVNAWMMRALWSWRRRRRRLARSG